MEDDFRPAPFKFLLVLDFVTLDIMVLKEEQKKRQKREKGENIDFVLNGAHLD